MYVLGETEPPPELAEDRAHRKQLSFPRSLRPFLDYVLPQPKRVGRAPEFSEM
jgi:hypothetical protein